MIGHGEIPALSSWFNGSWRVPLNFQVVLAHLLLVGSFPGNALDPVLWSAADPTAAFSISAGKLMINGGNNNDGQTVLQFAEQIQMAGSVRLQHGAAEPLASNHLPLTALMQAEGWVLVAADREGYPPGSEVVIRPWL